MSAHPTLTVLSLGGGVQSSVMALMAGEGAFDRLTDCAISAPPAMGGDDAQVAGAARQGGGDRLQIVGGAGLRQGAVPALPSDAPGPGGRARRAGPGSRKTVGRDRERVRGSLWSVIGDAEALAGVGRLRWRAGAGRRCAAKGAAYRACGLTPG